MSKKKAQAEIVELEAKMQAAVAEGDFDKAAAHRDARDAIRSKLKGKEDEGLSLFSWPKEKPYTIDDWTNLHIDSVLCEKMGWTCVDSPDGIVLRGIDPRTGTHKTIPSYMDSKTNATMRQLILWGARCKDGSPLYYECGGAVEYVGLDALDQRCLNRGFWARFRHHKAASPSEGLEWFHSTGYSVEMATCRAACKLFEKLTLPTLPDWYLPRKKKR